MCLSQYWISLVLVVATLLSCDGISPMIKTGHKIPAPLSAEPDLTDNMVLAGRFRVLGTVPMDKDIIPPAMRFAMTTTPDITNWGRKLGSGLTGCAILLRDDTDPGSYYALKIPIAGGNFADVPTTNQRLFASTQPVRFDNLRNEYFIMLEAQAIPEANTMFVTPIGSIWAGKLGNPGCVDEPDPIPVTYRIFDPGQRLLYFSAADGRPLPKCYHAFRGLITELCSGDFKWYLSKANPNRNLVAALEQNFVTAVKALHAAGIQHGDISTQNLLMCNGMLKLGDFGGSKREAAYTKAQWSNYLDVDRARVFDTLLAADQEFEPQCQPPMPALEFDCTVKNWVSHDRTCKLAANSWFLQWKEDGALEYKRSLLEVKTVVPDDAAAVCWEVSGILYKLQTAISFERSTRKICVRGNGTPAATVRTALLARQTCFL